MSAAEIVQLSSGEHTDRRVYFEIDETAPQPHAWFRVALEFSVGFVLAPGEEDARAFFAKARPKQQVRSIELIGVDIDRDRVMRELGCSSADIAKAIRIGAIWRDGPPPKSKPQRQHLDADRALVPWKEVKEILGGKSRAWIFRHFRTRDGCVLRKDLDAYVASLSSK